MRLQRPDRGSGDSHFLRGRAARAPLQRCASALQNRYRLRAPFSKGNAAGQRAVGIPMLGIARRHLRTDLDYVALFAAERRRGAPLARFFGGRM